MTHRTSCVNFVSPCHRSNHGHRSDSAAVRWLEAEEDPRVVALRILGAKTRDNESSSCGVSVGNYLVVEF